MADTTELLTGLLCVGMSKNRERLAINLKDPGTSHCRGTFC